MVSKLRKQSTLTFLRPSGNWNLSGEWVVSGTPISIPSEGNIQPYREGTSQMTLPEGFKSEEALIYYTETPIHTVSQFTKTLADYTTIDGLVYIAHKAENWSRYTLKSNHYKVLLVRKDQPTNGGL